MTFPSKSMGLWLALAASSCSGEEETPPVDEPLDCSLGDTWESFGEGYVRTWCHGCHSADLTTTEERFDAPADVNFDTLAEVRQWAPAMRVLVLDDALETRMPPAGGVPDVERERFVDWIDCGLPGVETVPTPTCADATTVEGDVTVASAADAAALCTGPIEIGGGLEITADAPLDCVCAVGGDLVVRGGAAMLPSLATVGGDLVASEGVTELSAPNLKTVAGSVSVTSAPALVELDLGELETVGGEMLVADVPALAEAAFQFLETVTGSLRIERVGARLLDLTFLESVGGDLVVQDAAITEFRGQGHALTSVGGDLVFADLPDWTAVLVFYGFSKLETVGGDLRFERLDQLPKLRMCAELEEVSGSVVIRETGIDELDSFDSLLAIGGDLTIADNPALGLVDRLEKLDTVGGAVSITGNPSLLSFLGLAGGLVDVGGLTIDGSDTSVVFPSFAALTTVRGDVRVAALSKITSIDSFGALSRVDGGITFEALPLATRIEFGGPLLTAIGGDLAWTATGVTTVERPPSLSAVGGALHVVDNAALVNVDPLRGLDSVGGDLVVTGNSALPAAEASSLPADFSVGGVVSIDGNGP